MPQATFRSSAIKIAAVLILGGVGLSGCATEKYVNEQIATVNSRVDGVDAKATAAQQRADAAAAAAQQAQSAADAAAASANNANQRLDALTPRVDSIEQKRVKRRPRG